jgi:DNA-binding NarL/FixJ family response regulator
MTPDHSGPTAPIRILLVDDHPALRKGLALFVSSEGMEVCAEAMRMADALACVEKSRPDVAIVDLELDGEDGLPLVAELKARGVPVLVYSMHGEGQIVERALAAGALGYVTKSEFWDILVGAIRAVSRGRRFVSPRAGATLAEWIAATDHATAIASTLSAKEREVYRLMGKGEGTNEIARAMDISTHTVESYYTRIQLKLGIDGMHKLRRHAVRHSRE